MEKDELVKEVLGTHTSRRYIKAKKERMGRIFPPGFRMGNWISILPHINFPEMDLDFKIVQEEEGYSGKHNSCISKAGRCENIRNLLARNGYSVIGVCCTGAQGIADYRQSGRRHCDLRIPF